MRVLIACEFSGIVRDAFIAKGHDAMSCDLLPTERPGPHHQGEVELILEDGWDMMIAFPPCTYLCNSGVCHLYMGGRKQAENSPINTERWDKMEAAAYFFNMILNRDCNKIAVENPIMHGFATKIIGRKPDQYVQPYQFGHKISKKTGLWLRNLPLLVPTKIVEPEWIYYKNGGRCSPDHYKNAFSKTRGKSRSITYQGIADCMAATWSEDLT
ncbi:hypothetical protein LCGC14_2683270 [marine sediment metagenome]|uniref:DNA cytosine methyltransferase n=1 Tax=marine sediment metagenome TaxID=412755 RepID=A0A0F8ZKR1_9ZZZZ